jgi:hypothetical protein
MNGIGVVFGAEMTNRKRLFTVCAHKVRNASAILGQFKCSLIMCVLSERCGVKVRSPEE